MAVLNEWTLGTALLVQNGRKSREKKWGPVFDCHFRVRFLTEGKIWENRKGAIRRLRPEVIVRASHL